MLTSSLTMGNQTVYDYFFLIYRLSLYVPSFLESGLSTSQDAKMAITFKKGYAKKGKEKYLLSVTIGQELCCTVCTYFTSFQALYKPIRKSLSQDQGLACDYRVSG